MSFEQYKQTVIEIAHASNAVWNTFCQMDAPDLPPNPLDAMQVQLVRWQQRNFGDVSPVSKVDVHMGLGIIEEFSEALMAKEILGSKGKLDGLGDVCVYAGQLLNANRMAIRPLMDLADLLAADWDGNSEAVDAFPIGAVGQFSHILLKREQKIRGYDNPEVWMPAMTYSVASIMALTRLDIVLSAIDLNFELDDKQLIQQTYIDVGSGVVLKRNWSANRLDGGTR